MMLDFYGDDAAAPSTAPATAPGTFWTPGFVIAALALGAAYWMHASKKSARRMAERQVTNRSAVQRELKRLRGERRARERGYIE